MTQGPAFQFYPGDWLSSTKIAMMTPAEEGAYIRLLCYCWNDPDCTIPDDDNLLAVLSRLGEGWLKGGSEKLRMCFTSHPKKPGRLFNARLLEERKKQAAWRKKSREGGRQSAKIRANTRDLKEQSGGSAGEGWFKGGSEMVRTKDEQNGNSSVSPLQSSSSPPKERKECEYPHTFINGGQEGWNEGCERFWTAFPKQKNKGDVERWFAKHRPSPELVDTMLAKLKELKLTDAWQEKNGQWVPFPVKWLQAKGWEDGAVVKLPPKKVRLAL